MTQFEALYGRIGWFEVGESSLCGPEIIYEALEKVRVIRDMLKTTYCQKNTIPITGEEILNSR